MPIIQQKEKSNTVNSTPKTPNKKYNKLLCIQNTTITMLVLFASSILAFSKRQSHFITDDYQHFNDLLTIPFVDFLLKPIDVHFAPLHRLITYFIFKVAPLNFSAALLTMALWWFITIFLVNRTVYHITSSKKTAWIATLLIGASPLWIHNFIWWSSAAHRLPYLALQAATFLFYLRYRNTNQTLNAILCCSVHVLALGFYVKAIFFPLYIISLEVCLTNRDQSYSRKGIFVFLVMALISTLYILWYVFLANTMRVPQGIDAASALMGAFELLCRTGGLLMLTSIDNPQEILASGVLWSALLVFLLWRNPRTALPIGILIMLLIIGYWLTLYGRAGMMLAFPSAAMRYYAEDLVIISVFFSTAASLDNRRNFHEKNVANPLSSLASLLFIILYPIGSYFSSVDISKKHYPDNKLTHDFMVKLDDSLGSLKKQEEINILIKDFPSFAFGFLGARLSMGKIMAHTYPNIHWIEPNQARGEVHTIDSMGRVQLASFLENPDFRDDESFPGWYPAESDHRWSQNQHATILFSSSEKKYYVGQLIIKGSILGHQHIWVKLNGIDIGNINLNETRSCEWSISFDATLIKKGANAFELYLPDAHQPTNGDKRILAISVSALEIR